MGDVFDGAVFHVPFPFVRDTYESVEEDGPFAMLSWKPGTDVILSGPEDTECVADGVGKMILTVVATFKPGRFPARVFYTRKWVSPDGKTFGKGALRIATREKFSRLTRGYRVPYSMREAA